MENNIQIFSNPEFGEVRIINGEDNEPRFCLSDVCRILNLRSYKVVQRLSEDMLSKYPLPTNGGRQLFTVVNEDGLYDTILESRKPEAKRFRKWVTSEVLPSIRKEGAYITPETLQRAITEPDFLIKLAINLKMEQECRKLADATIAEQHTLIVAQENTMKEMTKRATFVDYILSEKKCVRISQIASEYGLSAQKLNSILYECGIQKKVNGQWLPMTKYAPYNYMKSVTATTEYGLKLSSMWTQSGRLFLYRFLKEKGIIPLFEKEMLKPQERTLFDGFEQR